MSNKKNVYIYCEGWTEEAFINDVLGPYFANMQIWVYPIVCETKRTSSKKYKGGVSDYRKIKKELYLICKHHHNEIVTTMFDYYAMPDNTPMIDCDDADLYSRIDKIEAAINQDIGLQNCHFNFSLHEFEGLLFSNPDSFGLIADAAVVEKIQEVKDSAPSPEHINNSPKTAPSKRLAALMPGYAKVKNGSILAQDMGIDVIMENCRHFAEWIKKIISLCSISTSSEV